MEGQGFCVGPEVLGGCSSAHHSPRQTWSEDVGSGIGLQFKPWQDIMNTFLLHFLAESKFFVAGYEVSQCAYESLLSGIKKRWFFSVTDLL